LEDQLDLPEDRRLALVLPDQLSQPPFGEVSPDIGMACMGSQRGKDGFRQLEDFE